MLESRQYVLWGSAGHAKVLDEAIRRLGGKVVGVFDSAPHVGSSLSGVPFLGGADVFASWVEDKSTGQELYGLVAIGGARGQDRLMLQNLMLQHGVRVEPLIHPLAFVADTVLLGTGSQILAMSVVAADVHIGAACIVNHKASIDHECDIGDGVHVAPGATLCGCVTLGMNVMVGAGAVILPRLRIGKNSIVGAGAVVTRDVPDGVVVAGNPASMRRSLPTDSDSREL